MADAQGTGWLCQGQAVVESGPRATVPQARGRCPSTLPSGGGKDYILLVSGEEKSDLRDLVVPGPPPSLDTLLPRLPSRTVLRGVKRTGAHQSPTRCGSALHLLVVGWASVTSSSSFEGAGAGYVAPVKHGWWASLSTDKIIALERPVLLGAPFPAPASWLAGDWGCWACQTPVVARSP